MFGLFKLLFSGKDKYKISCPVCGTEGKMFTKGGAYEGIFEISGKTENGGLAIKECPKCKNSLAYDPLSGRVSRDNS